MGCHLKVWLTKVSTFSSTLRGEVWRYPCWIQSTCYAHDPKPQEYGIAMVPQKQRPSWKLTELLALHCKGQNTTWWAHQRPLALKGPVSQLKPSQFQSDFLNSFRTFLGKMTGKEALHWGGHDWVTSEKKQVVLGLKRSGQNWWRFILHCHECRS